LTGAATVVTTGIALARRAASLAALGLVGESFLGVEFLLTGSEDEFLATVLADESFVLIHVIPHYKFIRHFWQFFIIVPKPSNVKHIRIIFLEFFRRKREAISVCFFPPL